ncbi:hypothetical protein ACVI1L_000700 [Bradyrhizobium sp. USDA 4516]
MRERTSAGTCEHTRTFDLDVLLEDASAKIEVKLLSPKAVEEAMHAWKEERKGDRNKGSEYALAAQSAS